jgi:hypothetical protein
MIIGPRVLQSKRERTNWQRPRRSGGTWAIGRVGGSSATERTITTVVPELSLASTTAGPRESVAAAARDVTNAPPARRIRTRRVGISPGSARGSPRPGMGANGGNRLSCTLLLSAMPSPTETTPGFARSAPPTKRGGVVESAIAWGVPETEIRDRCHDTLARVFAGEPQEVVFDCCVAYVGRA